METLWSKGPSSIRELQEAFPEAGRPAYTTVQTVVYLLGIQRRPCDTRETQSQQRPRLRSGRVAQFARSAA